MRFFENWGGDLINIDEIKRFYSLIDEGCYYSYIETKDGKSYSFIELCHIFTFDGEDYKIKHSDATLLNGIALSILLECEDNIIIPHEILDQKVWDIFEQKKMKEKDEEASS